MRQALDLVVTEATHDEATSWPTWLDAPRAIGDFTDADKAEARGRALMTEGKWVEAERYLLRAYRDSDGSDEIATLLASAYDELGWALPRAHLASRDA